MEATESQVTLLIRLLIRAKWAVPVALIGAIAAALATSVYVRASYTPRYSSEAIAVVRPLPGFDVRFPEQGVINKIGEGTRQETPPFLPEPLTAVDYALLVQSDEVTAAVAAAYNNRFRPQTDLTGSQLKSVLAATTVLEIKTPYEAKYHPTIQMRATASTPETAYQLASTWGEIAEQWFAEYNSSIRRRVFDAVDAEYQEAREALNALDTSPTANREDEPAKWLAATNRTQREAKTQQAVVTCLAEARLQARLALANAVPEFEVVAQPILPPSHGRPRQAHLAFAAFAAVFVCLWVAGVVVVVLRDVAADLGREPSEDPAVK